MQKSTEKQSCQRVLQLHKACNRFLKNFFNFLLCADGAQLAKPAIVHHHRLGLRVKGYEALLAGSHVVISAATRLWGIVVKRWG